MENQFYHISWAPLSVTIFITYVRNLRNGCYANENMYQKIIFLFLIRNTY